MVTVSLTMPCACSPSTSAAGPRATAAAATVTAKTSASAILPSFAATELVSGTTTPKGQRALDPAEVAAGILDRIARPRPQLTVPRSLAPTVRRSALYPDRLKRALYHRFGVDTIFLNVDRAARADYDARIRSGRRAGSD